MTTTEYQVLKNPSQVSMDFDQARLDQVIGLLDDPEIEDAMLRVDPKISAKKIILGEQSRMRSLAGVFHDRFYRLPLERLREENVLKNNYSLSELGVSLGAHLPMIPPDLQPAYMEGLDYKEYIVVGAKAAITKFKQDGKLTGEFNIYLGDESEKISRADISILSLVSQYDAGHFGSLAWLIKHGNVGINGDVIHGPILVDQKDLNDGLIPINCNRFPAIDCGIAWHLKGNPHETIFGTVYDATLCLEPSIYDDALITHLSVNGDNYEGWVTVFKDGSDTFAEGWGYQETDHASSDDLKNIAALRTTFRQMYQNLAAATDNKRVWDGLSGLAMAPYAAQNHFLTEMMITTAKDQSGKDHLGLGRPFIPGTLPLAMLLRNDPETQLLAAKGYLSEVGRGKTFGSVGALYEVIEHYINPQNDFSKLFDYCNPPLVTTIIYHH